MFYIHGTLHIPCNSVGLMLGQRLRRWPNIEPTLHQKSWKLMFNPLTVGPDFIGFSFLYNTSRRQRPLNEKGPLCIHCNNVGLMFATLAQDWIQHCIKNPGKLSFTYAPLVSTSDTLNLMHWNIFAWAEKPTFFQFKIVIKCLNSLFPLHSNTYVMGLRRHYK